MGDRLSIMLLEDEEAHVQLILRKLKDSKYSINWVKSIAEAENFLTSHIPDIIVADWRLPDGNAIELLPKNKEHLQFPMIILTSYGNETNAVEVIKAGVIDYIVKSTDTFNNIHIIIKRALREWKNIVSRHNAEKALIESEKRYKNLVENSPIGIYRTTPDGKPLMANPSITKTLGFSSFEDIKKNMDISKDGYVDMSNRDKFIEIIERDGIIRDFEAWWKNKNNQPILMLENAIAVRDEEGKTIYYEGTATDITEKKKDEKELFSIHQKNQALLQAIPDLIFILDRSGKIVDFKAQDFGKWILTPYKIIGQNISKIGFSELSLITLKNDINAAFETQNIQTSEYEVALPNGLRTYESRMIAMNELELLAIVRDITERKQSEEILINNEKRFRYLIENAYDVISIINIEGVIIYCTDIFEKFFGYKSQSIIGKKIFDFIHPDDLLKIEESFEILTQFPGYHLTIEYKFLHNDGNYRQTESVAVNHLQNNLINGIIFTTREITQRVETEELKRNIAIAEKTAQIKQQFLANMSHEIRTPMNAIMGMLELINKSQLNETQLDFIQTIQGASENLLCIINDILDLSKIEAGKMDLKLSTLNIHETAMKIKRLFEETAKNKCLDFNISIANDIVKFVKADENRIIQIISNLVSNAFKFTKKGSINVNFSLASQDNEIIKFLVEVVDTGIGIAEPDQLKLFSEFSQLDNTLTRSYEGTGLGLAISKELSELMGGEIGVNSEYNKGSTFWFTFTAIPSEESDYISVKNFYQNYKDMKFNISVLLVEDKLVNQKVETLILENIGCKVSLAVNGKEAVDMISAGLKYDIVFMDIQMPIMDGVEAVSILRKKYSKLPPIIGLSANAMEGDAERYIKLGMDDYISKPFTANQIKEKLFKWTYLRKE